MALIADAIRDCSKRGDSVLDVFGGSGSTLIAADQCGRIARLIEIDPLYCDTIIRRFERVTGEQARHAETGATFAKAAMDRMDARDSDDGSDPLPPVSMQIGAPEKPGSRSPSVSAVEGGR